MTTSWHSNASGLILSREQELVATVEDTFVEVFLARLHLIENAPELLRWAKEVTTLSRELGISEGGPNNARLKVALDELYQVVSRAERVYP